MLRPTAVIVLLLALGLRAGPTSAEEPNPLAEPIKGILFEADEGLGQLASKGIRRGLEKARVPRYGLRQATKPEAIEAVLEALETEKPTLLFVLGRETARLLGDRLGDVPRVYVDAAWSVNGKPVPADPSPKGRAAIVRSVLGGARMAELLRGLGFERTRPIAQLSWHEPRAAPPESVQRLAAAAGFEPVQPHETPDLLLHMRIRAGEALPTSARLAERAATLRVPLVTDDLAHWQARAASVALLPDFELLGRVAADEGRRLLLQAEAGEKPTAPRRRAVASYEIRVDLGAAKRQGFEPPLALVAQADRVRRGPPARRRKP